MVGKFVHELAETLTSGYVALAIASEGGTVSRELDTGLGGDRTGNMVQFAWEALALVKEEVNARPTMWKCLANVVWRTEWRIWWFQHAVQLSGARERWTWAPAVPVKRFRKLHGQETVDSSRHPKNFHAYRERKSYYSNAKFVQIEKPETEQSA